MQSSSAQTLRGIRFFYMDEIFTPANLLRLVRGCPLLSEFEGDSGELLSPIEHGKTVKAINKLLKSRGGKKNQYRPLWTWPRRNGVAQAPWVGKPEATASRPTRSGDALRVRVRRGLREPR